jgi:hypothetical protein
MFYYLYGSYATEKVRWNRQQSRNKWSSRYTQAYKSSKEMSHTFFN